MSSQWSDYTLTPSGGFHQATSCSLLTFRESVGWEGHGQVQLASEPCLVPGRTQLSFCPFRLQIHVYDGVRMRRGSCSPGLVPAWVLPPPAAVPCGHCLWAWKPAPDPPYVSTWISPSLVVAICLHYTPSVMPMEGPLQDPHSAVPSSSERHYLGPQGAGPASWDLDCSCGMSTDLGRSLLLPYPGCVWAAPYTHTVRGVGSGCHCTPSSQMLPARGEKQVGLP